MRRGENRVLFGAASTLVFVNNIHERPQIVAVRHYSLTFIADHGRLLVFVARSSSSPVRPYSSPLPLAKTIVFASIVLLGSFASDRSRSSRSLAFTARSSLIAVYSELLLTPVRPVPFGAASL